MDETIQARYQDGLQYDAGMSKTFSGYDQLPLTMLAYLSVRLGDNATVLDVGCGTGTTLITYATHKPNWSLVGVDLSETMLKLAQSKIDTQAMSSRIQLQQGTITTLPQAETFDATTMILVEHLLPDDGTKLALLKGIAQRLKSGGWFILAGLHGDFATAETQSAFNVWLEYVRFQGFSDERLKELRKRATVEDSIISEARICALLDEAGFHHTEQIYKAHLVGGWLTQKK